MSLIEVKEDKLSFLVEYTISKENIKKILTRKEMQEKYNIDLLIEDTDYNVELIFNKLTNQKIEIKSINTSIEQLIADKIDEIVKEILFEQF